MRKKPTKEAGQDDGTMGDGLDEILNPYLRLALLLMGKPRFLEMIARVLGVNIQGDREAARPKRTMEEEGKE